MKFFDPDQEGIAIDASSKRLVMSSNYKDCIYPEDFSSRSASCRKSRQIPRRNSLLWIPFSILLPRPVPESGCEENTFVLLIS